MINAFLGVPLGFVIYFAYSLTNNYGLAVLIFTVIVKVILFPVNIAAHKNSIRFLPLQPSLNIIKRRYSSDKERLNEERYELFKREKYNPFIGLVPLFLQLFLIMGVMQVMYHPLQHVIRLDSDIIASLIQAVRDIYGARGGSGEQLMVMEAVGHAENLPVFQAALSGFQNPESILQLISGTNLNFLGLNLGETPSLLTPSIALIVPFLSGLTALAYCFVQNAISPGALTQSVKANWGMTIFTVTLSLYFAFVTPVGVGIYWTAGNILGIGVVVLLNLLYDPKKLAGEAVARFKSDKKTPEEIREEKRRKKELTEREKRDSARFGAAEKRLVFYALTSGQYKYYAEIIEYISRNSDIQIHYLTNDPKDALFEDAPEGVIPYYAGQRKTIGLMMKMDTDILVTTVPDLQSYHMKRSIVRDDIEYIYIPHGPASTHLTMREAAYDNFDTIFCVGPHQAAEIRRREELAELTAKTLVKAGYGLYDQLAGSYASLADTVNKNPRILIAPSWQADNIMELCIESLLDSLLGNGYVLIVRPHPQYVSMFPERMKALTEKYAGQTSDGELVFELDFAGNESIFLSDLLITDWSGIAYEFSYCTLKPCVFINTPMKVMNRNYEQYGLEVLDISLRDKVGVSVAPDALKGLSGVVAGILANKDSYKDKIEQVVSRCLYHPGRNGEAGGKYILNRLKPQVKGG